jgi:beta-glucanase (GH16 family)
MSLNYQFARPIYRSVQPIAMAILTACFAVAALACPLVKVEAAPPPGYKLVWSDEFDQPIGSPPSQSKWNYETGSNGWGNDEMEDYTNKIANSHVIADPDAVDGRALAIVATSDGHGRYYSARLDSAGHADLGLGFVEARIKIPDAQGTWPAFWMVGSNIPQVGWPACGELDIMEHVGLPSWPGNIRSSLHSKGAHGEENFAADYHLPTGQAFSTGYHLFQMLRTKDLVSYYVDGNLLETHTSRDITDAPWPFNSPEYFILNLAIGGNWPGPPNASTVFPQTMLIDYVRAYSGSDTAPPPAPTDFRAEQAADGGRLLLSWKDVTGVTSYDVFRKQVGTPNGSSELVVAGVDADSYTDNIPTPGIKYAYSVSAHNGAGESVRSVSVIASAKRAVESPYGGKPWPIPGRIEAADYDAGGNGLAYHVVSQVNQGGANRMDETVGVEACSDPGSAYDIGFSEDGEWLKYTVDVAASGQYAVRLRVANGSGHPASLHLEDESGANLSGQLAIPVTGGWQAWTTVGTAVNLTAGKHVLRVFYDRDGFNLASMTFAEGQSSGG